jgi:hypothetical protein
MSDSDEWPRPGSREDDRSRSRSRRARRALRPDLAAARAAAEQDAAEAALAREYGLASLDALAPAAPSPTEPVAREHVAFAPLLEASPVAGLDQIAPLIEGSPARISVALLREIDAVAEGLIDEAVASVALAGAPVADGAPSTPPVAGLDFSVDSDILEAVGRREEADRELRVTLSDAELVVAAVEQPPLAGAWLTAEAYEIARSFPARTFRDIPRSQRRPFASLRAEVAAGCRGEEKAVFHRLFDLLPLLILSAPAQQRGGKKHKRQSKASIVRDRIARIRAGGAEKQLAMVLREQLQSGPQAAAGSSDVPWSEVLRLCAAHELSRATALLGTAGVAPRCRATAASMRAKLETPVREPVEPPGAQAGQACWNEMRQELDSFFSKAVRSAPRGSAAGWSGDRFEFHKATFVAASEAEWAAILDAYTDLATGEVPPEVAAGWQRARGFALLKDGGGIRPIAAHEPLRRAVTRALLKTAEWSARKQLAPLQSAIGVHGGAEALGLAARLFAQRHPSWVVLKLDIANAFGSCSRAAALRELEAAGFECGLLATFLRRLLCKPSRFAYDFADESGQPVREWIEAHEGADQGDPAGPVIFCSAFAAVLRALRESLAGLAAVPLFVGAYMDDLCLVVPPECVGQALELAASECAKAHLTLSESKSQAWSAGGRLPEAHGLRAELVDGTVVVARPCPSGFAVAGVPLGEAVASEVASRVLVETRRDCGRLLVMCEKGPGGRERCESARAILLECLQLRLDFLSRVSSPAELQGPAAEFDALIFDTFRQVYGLEPAELKETSVAQIHRPTARGGFGVRRLATRLRYNFIDGALGAASHIARVAGAGLFATATPYEQALAAVEASIAEEGGPEPPCWTVVSASQGDEDDKKEQRRWGANAFDAKRDRELKLEQIERARQDLNAAARVESGSGPGAAWLGSTADFGEDAIDTAPGATVHGPRLKDPARRPSRPRPETVAIPDAEAKALVRFRLGLFRGGGRCGRVTSDPHAKKRFCDCGDATARHRVQCPCGPWAIWRHNRLARLLQLLILEIPGTSVRWTPRTAFWRRGTEAGEPDLRVDAPEWEWPLYIDVAVVFPTSSSPGRMAKRAEGDKEAAYPVWAAEAREQVVDFSPCVVEAFGRFGPRSADLIRTLAGRNAKAWGLTPGVEVRRWFSLLSRRLQIDQADILLNSCR